MNFTNDNIGNLKFILIRQTGSFLLKKNGQFGYASLYLIFRNYFPGCFSDSCLKLNSEQKNDFRRKKCVIILPKNVVEVYVFKNLKIDFLTILLVNLHFIDLNFD